MLKQARIKKVNKIKVLVVSNSMDFTTDFVCLELKKRGKSFLRINRDEFSKYKITMDVLSSSMKIQMEEEQYLFEDVETNSCYYRAPIYLRDIYQPLLSKEEQLYRMQWTAFCRNLAIYRNIIWMNNPEATFCAENKLLQLKRAHEIGFMCPQTTVTNTAANSFGESNQYIVKSLDTGILRVDDKEAFIYSNKVNGKELRSSELGLAPVIIQDYINPKVDIRVTVVGKRVYPVRILKDGKGVEGDWRLKKSGIEFIPFDLPENVKNKCILLLNTFGLAFGGIDLIESNGAFFFIEVNPTGEWAWLVSSAKMLIQEGICDFLEGRNA